MNVHGAIVENDLSSRLRDNERRKIALQASGVFTQGMGYAFDSGERITLEPGYAAEQQNRLAG